MKTERKDKRLNVLATEIPGSAGAWRLVSIAVVLTALLFCSRPGSTGAQRGVRDFGAADDAAGRGVQVIAPGQVRFSVDGNGRWLELVPAWDPRRSLIAGGGFFLLAAEEDGEMKEVVNTAYDKLVRGGGVPAIGKCCEGVVGGLRAPSMNPDDDRDGLVDEDRLDGIDNDGDGAVDEDFAAIGDEMVVAVYATPGIPFQPRLEFHQEAYAWSLPHIDGMIFLSLKVRNAGPKPLYRVRLGACIERSGAFDLALVGAGSGYDSAVFGAEAPESEGGGRAPVRALACGETGATVGIVVFPSRGGAYEDAGLRYGCRERAMGRKALARAFSNAREDASGQPGPTALLDSLTPGGSVPVSGDLLLYGASPEIGRLEPGSEFGIDIALFVARDRRGVELAAANALKTYLGDGEHAYIPPPISLTPRMLWGEYAARGDDEVSLMLEETGARLLHPRRVRHLTGVDPRSMEIEEISPGVAQLVIRGKAAEGILRRQERVVLKGRLDTGEFFEAILGPAQVGSDNSRISAGTADAYWKTPGKLGEEWLKGSPNPFRDGTTVSYEIPRYIEQEDGSLLKTGGAVAASVKVYNVLGRLVSVLVEDSMMPGVYSVDWPAVDEQGNPVASGVYYVKLQIERRYITKRLILLK